MMYMRAGNPVISLASCAKRPRIVQDIASALLCSASARRPASRCMDTLCACTTNQISTQSGHRHAAGEI